MPIISQRKALLRRLDKEIFIAAVDSVLESSSESETEESDAVMFSDDDLEDLLEVKRALQTHRYLQRRVPVPKSKHFVECLLPVLDEGRFRREMRMCRSAFEKVVELISGHPVFTNSSRHQQKPVELQLAVALFRFGHYGNAASNGRLARTFGLSEGAVDAYTNRVMTALLSLMPTTLRWPTAAERVDIKRRLLAEKGFPDCVGMVDGTLVVLDKCPSFNGEDYYSRKKLYGLSAMVVSDDRRRILFASTGYPGSAHDMRVYSGSELAINPAKFYSQGEYLLGDSGYKSSQYLVAAYKAPATFIQDNSDFNTFLAETRVVNEHTIGVLKGRFQSLRGLRIAISDKRSHGRAVAWFLVCCVLHNILHDLNDPVDDTWIEGELPDINQVADLLDPEPMDAGRIKRETVRDFVLALKRNV